MNQKVFACLAGRSCSLLWLQLHRLSGGLARHLPAGSGTAAGGPSGRKPWSGAESQGGRIAHVTLKIMDRSVLAASVLTAPSGFVVVGQLEVTGTTQRDLHLRPEECFLFWLQSQRFGSHPRSAPILLC